MVAVLLIGMLLVNCLFLLSMIAYVAYDCYRLKKKFNNGRCKKCDVRLKKVGEDEHGFYRLRCNRCYDDMFIPEILVSKDKIIL